MNHSCKRYLPLLFAVVAVSNGCAKQAVIRPDAVVAPAAANPAAAAHINQGAAPNQGALPAPATALSATAANTKTPAVATDEQNTARSAKEALSAAELQKALAKVYFDFDSSLLNETARQTLSGNFAYLQLNPQLKVRVAGNCDERGSDEYNLALGERRARVAVSYLATLGISADRLSTISYGKEKPADPGHDEAAWARNRRDEFIVAR